MKNYLFSNGNIRKRKRQYITFNVSKNKLAFSLQELVKHGTQKIYMICIFYFSNKTKNSMYSKIYEYKSNYKMTGPFANNYTNYEK